MMQGSGQPYWSPGTRAAWERRKAALEARLTEARGRVEREAVKPDEEDLLVVDLQVDPSYQRTGTSVDMTKVTDYALNWNWDRCGRLVVNQRPDGSYWIIDGGHRWLAYKLLYPAPLLPGATLPCFVLHKQTVEEEAVEFDKLNDDRTAVAYEFKFKARLRYGEYFAATTVMCIEGAGLTAVHVRDRRGHKPQPGDCHAIATCERIVRQTDGETLSTVLGLLVGAWGKEPTGYHRAIIMAVYDFHVRYAGEYNPKQLMALLRVATPKGLIEAVPVEAAPTARAVRMSLFLYEQYNRKRPQHTRLSSFTLDGGNGFQRVVRRYKRRKAQQP